MDWIEVEGQTRAEAEEKLLEALNARDISDLDVEDVKVTRKFMGLGGRKIKLRGRRKSDESAPVEEESHAEPEPIVEPEERAPAPVEEPVPAAVKTPGNGIVTGATKYRPWAAEGPKAIVIPPEGKGFGGKLFSVEPLEEEEPPGADEVEEPEVEKEVDEKEEEFTPPVYEDTDDSPVTDEDRERAVVFVKGILDRMDMAGEVKGHKLADRLLVIIDTDDSGGLLIGRKGETLDSLQYLTDIVVNRQREERVRIILDTEHYRERRRFKVYQIAVRAAERAAGKRSPVRLSPMSPAERQIVHTTLADDRRVETISEGQGDRRRVVVYPSRSRKTPSKSGGGGRRR